MLVIPPGVGTIHPSGTHVSKSSDVFPAKLAIRGPCLLDIRVCVGGLAPSGSHVPDPAP